MKVFNKFRTEFDNILLRIYTCFAYPKNQSHFAVPYISQFGNPLYAEKVLKDGAKITDDTKWQNTGAISPDEYAEWALVTCGMACTSMALRYFHNTKIGTVELAKEASKDGVYNRIGDEISDMQYREYSTWVKKYAIRAKVYTRLNRRDLEYLLSKDNLIIASVNANIRGYKTAPDNRKGGHLILITGYDRSAGTITFHNPSGFLSLGTQADHTMKWQDFDKFFASRCIAMRDSIAQVTD